MDEDSDMNASDKDGKAIAKLASTGRETFSDEIFRSPAEARATIDSPVMTKLSATGTDPETKYNAADIQLQSFEKVATGTQTEIFEGPNKFAPRNVIFAIIIFVSAAMWIVGVCGVWALWLDHREFCIKTEEMGGAFADGMACLPGGPTLDLVMVAYLLDLLGLSVLGYTLKEGTWTHYKVLVLAVMNIVVQIFIATTDMFNVETKTKALGSEAMAVSVGTTALLVTNYALIVLVSPSDHTLIGRFLMRNDWPKGWPVPKAFRNQNGKKIDDVEKGSPASVSDEPAVQV